MYSHKASHKQKLGSREAGVPGGKLRQELAIGTRQCVHQEVDKAHSTARSDFMKWVVPPACWGQLLKDTFMRSGLTVQTTK